MEKFNRTYGHYPKYPVADAGYGSYNNYLYCEEHGMEKIHEIYHVCTKETTDKKYHENPVSCCKLCKKMQMEIFMPKRSKIPLQENTACEI